MRSVTPRVFLIGETRIVPDGLQAYLKHLGIPHWSTDAGSDAEKLAEFYGRLCYRSFEVGLNPNVTKIREGNALYLENILKSAHGSVLEHPQFNFVFADVSRVFTHELVRHRAGTAISQESLRYVRLTDIGFWLPVCFAEDEVVCELVTSTVEILEDMQRTLAAHFKLDEGALPFAKKKEVTSAMRRLAPEGLATTIGWSANARALRHVIEMRTSEGAEEEIRLVFAEVAATVSERYPNFFQGYDIQDINGIPSYVPAYRKV